MADGSQERKPSCLPGAVIRRPRRGIKLIFFLNLLKFSGVDVWQNHVITKMNPMPLM